jgi:AcrR family transcriptional regulator
MHRKKLTGSERKQDILQKSARIFSLYGYDGVSMRQVAEECRVNEALLYKHFSGKADLFKEVIEGLGPLIDFNLRKIAQGESDSFKSLESVVKALVFEPEENLHILTLIIHGMAASERQEIVREVVRKGFAKLNDLIFELIEDGRLDGSMKQDIDSVNCAWCILSRSMCSRISIALKPTGPISDTVGNTFVGLLLDCVNSENDAHKNCCGSAELLKSLSPS